MTQSPERYAAVVGAGIGGLAAALALSRRGWRVTVHERAATLDPVGSGLSVAPNALRALDQLGLGDRIRAHAAAQGEAALRRPSGRRLARTSTEGFARAYGDPIVVLHRAELVAALADRLPAGALRTGGAVHLADPGDAHRPAVLETPDGPLTADLVVAADGLRSATRGQLFPDHPGPRYAGCTSWRTIVPRPAPATGFTDSSLSNPSAVAVDLGGSVWVANAGNGSVTRILGAAAPVAPLSTASKNKTTGAKP